MNPRLSLFRAVFSDLWGRDSTVHARGPCHLMWHGPLACTVRARGDPEHGVRMGQPGVDASAVASAGAAAGAAIGAGAGAGAGRGPPGPPGAPAGRTRDRRNNWRTAL